MNANWVPQLQKMCSVRFDDLGLIIRIVWVYNKGGRHDFLLNTVYRSDRQ